MQTLKSKGATVAITLFFALILAGCGGGSSSRSGASALSPEEEVQRETRTPATITVVREAAAAIPKLGGPSASVTQSDNTDRSGVTEDTVTADASYGSNGELLFTVSDDETAAVSVSNDGSTPDTTVIASDNGLPREDADISTRLMLPDGTRYRSRILRQEEDDGREVVMIYTDRQNQADTDYLVGGIWLFASDDGSEHAVAAFADGPDANLTPTAYLTTTATATYRGVAYGIGVGRDFEQYSWEFQAPVRLTASFGVSPTISGTIPTLADRDVAVDSGERFNEFTDDEGNPETSLTLGSATISTTAAGGFFTGDVTGTTVAEDGTTLNYLGKWGGQFYGTQAQTVGGTFGASGSIGTEEETIMGMFGAYKQ